jgi:hypothetical protein
LYCEVRGDVGVTEDQVTALQVVGTGVDPVTSRFSGRKAGKTVSRW